MKNLLLLIAAIAALCLSALYWYLTHSSHKIDAVDIGSTMGEQLSAAWQQRLEPLPSDAQTILKKGLKCHKFGGDDISLLSPEDQKEWEQLKSDSLDKELEQTRSKYSSNSKVINALNCVEETAAADDCPDDK